VRLTDGVAGEGERPSCLPEATAFLEAVDDLEAEVYFALLGGKLVSFCERKGQQGGIPPFMLVCTNLRIGGMPHFFKNSSNAPRSGFQGGSPSLGALTN